MAKNVSELTVTINAKLDVDRKTAETCLRLVEAYVNANGVRLMCDHEENGEVSLRYDYPDMSAERTCKTCYADGMDLNETDLPCWICKGDHSEWRTKEEKE